MDGGIDTADEFVAHLHIARQCFAALHHIAITRTLHHLHSVLFLIQTDLAAYPHALAEHIYKVVVDTVDLLAKEGERFSAVGFCAIEGYKRIDDDIQHFGSDLLGGIAPSAIGIAVALDDKPVKSHIISLLRERSYEFALPTDMAGIADDGDIGHAASELDRDMPLRHIAVEMLPISRETAMDSSHTLHAGILNTLYGTDPEFEIGIHGILHKHGHILPDGSQGVGNLLHGKWIGGSARAYPKQIHACLDGCLNVGLGGNFGGDIHPCLLLHFLEPRETLDPHPFESSGFGAGFPYSGTEHFSSE